MLHVEDVEENANNQLTKAAMKATGTESGDDPGFKI